MTTLPCPTVAVNSDPEPVHEPEPTALDALLRTRLHLLAALANVNALIRGEVSAQPLPWIAARSIRRGGQ